MKNTSVKARLALTFGVLAFIVLLVAGLSIESLYEANARFEGYVAGINARAAMAARLRAAVDVRAIAARNLVLLTQEADLALEKQVVTKAHADATESLKSLQELGSAADVPDRIREMIAAIARIEKSYAPVALGIVDLSVQGQKEAATRQLNEVCRPLLAALIKATDDYAAYTAERAQGLIRQSHADYLARRNGLLLAGTIAVLFAVIAGYLITRSLWHQLGAEPSDLRSIVDQVADGDLTRDITVRRGDENSVLAMVQRMQASLSGIVTTVRSGSESVSSASEQISASNMELASRTETQASALEQTASSMEQFNSTVQQNADNARQANQLAKSASAVAEHGGQVVGDVVEMMQGINESSRRIADIIGVIDSIAFQTNILALNAAVEAARAGEQGKGFAVVASEVRSLAVRSSEAAREIKTLITASVDRVEQGAVLVDDAGRTMADIVTGIRRVAAIIGDISAASEEQSRGVSQVSEAVSHMDRATQENAAMVEEMSAASRDMYEKAHQLVQTVRVFKLASAP